MPGDTRHRRDSRGFTLIELLIVVAVIGLIAAIAIPAFMYSLDRSKQQATLSDMRSLGGAIAQYSIDHSFFPDSSLTNAQLHAVLTPYSGESLVVEDRWFHDFSYDTDGLNYYSVECHGRDGLDGTNITYGTRNDFDLDMIYASGFFAAAPTR